MRPSCRAILIALACAGCASTPGVDQGGAGPSGFVVVTAGGTALIDGEDDVPPTLDLSLAGADLDPGLVTVRLDGNALALLGDRGSLQARVSPMTFSSGHRLVLEIRGRPAQAIGFRVVGRTGVSVAAWAGGAGRVTADLAFERAPNRAAVVAGLSATQLLWLDDTHLRLSWLAAPQALEVHAGAATARGSVLEGPLRLNLASLRAGELRRATLPAAPVPPPHLALTVWTTDSAASQESTQVHAGAAALLSPTGWRATVDGGLEGSPEPSALRAAGAAGRPVWPLLANEMSRTAISQFLAAPPARARLISTMVTEVRRLGAGGVHLDFEGIDGDDRTRFTGFVRELAGGLHAAGAQLAVDVVPHRPGIVNHASAAYDDPALAAAADRLVVMCYDQHNQAGDPGPVAGLDWQGQELAGTIAGVPPGRVILGVPFYGRRWSGGEVNSTDYAGGVSQALGEADVAYDYNFAAATPVLRSRPGNVSTQLWFDDADSLLRKLAPVGRLRLAGAAAWRTGFEDPRVWAAIHASG